MSIAQHIARAIADDGLIAPGECVVAACSGGADSLALLLGLHELAQTEQLPVRLCCCHLDHGLRGEDSAADRRFVEQQCAALDVPVHAETVHLPDPSEATARNTRLAFFARAAAHFSADAVATGHTADDQAETVLFRILRGTGPSGLAGIAPARPLQPPAPNPRLVRPLLQTARTDIEAWLCARGIAWREDATNRQSHYRRNRIRHELLPLLRETYNPQVDDALRRLAALEQQRNDLLQPFVASWLDEALTDDAPDRLRLIRPVLKQCSRAQQLEILRAAVRRLGTAEGALGLAHLRQLAELVDAKTGTQAELPGALRARAEYDWLELSVAEAEPAAVFDLELPVPGEVTLPDGRRVRAETATNVPAPNAAAGDPRREYIDARAVSGVLRVRNRRPGDRLVPLGMNAARKVKDVLIDAKVPASRRQRTVVVESNNGIVWLAPWRLADHAKLTEGTKEAILLVLEPAAEDDQ